MRLAESRVTEVIIRLENKRKMKQLTVVPGGPAGPWKEETTKDLTPADLTPTAYLPDVTLLLYGDVK